MERTIYWLIAQRHAYIAARLAYGEDANPDAVAAWVMIGAEAVRDPDVRKIYQRAITREVALVRKLLRAYLVESNKRVRKLAVLASAAFPSACGRISQQHQMPASAVPADTNVCSTCTYIGVMWA